VSRWLASAPGKLVLLGEYAVLDGAPALVMAVERYCRVELAACEPPACRVEAPQLDRAVMPLDEQGRFIERGPDGDAPGAGTGQQAIG